MGCKGGGLKAGVACPDFPCRGPSGAAPLPASRAMVWWGGGCRKSFTGAGKSVKGWIGIGGSSEKYGKGPGRQLEGRGRTERD